VDAKNERKRKYHKAAQASSVKHKAADTATLLPDVAPSMPPPPARGGDGDGMD
jgi:hypothetical protein